MHKPHPIASNPVRCADALSKKHDICYVPPIKRSVVTLHDALSQDIELAHSPIIQKILDAHYESILHGKGLRF